MSDHKHLIAREAVDLEVRFTATGEDGTLEGVAVRFDTVDAYRTSFDRRAFTWEGQSLPLLWSHRPDEVLGSVRSIAPDGDGLKITAKLNLDVQRAREARSMLLAGDIAGLSIGFKRLADEARAGGVRHITKARLVEVSLVAVPAVPGSTVTSVRNAAGAAPEEDTMSEHTETAPDVAAMEARFATVETRLGERITTELRGIADRLAAVETRANRPAIGNPANPEGDLERRAFLDYVRHGEQRMGADEARALTVADSASAGYLAPEAIGSEILKALVEASPIRQYARVVSVSAQSIKYPRRLTGPAATWTEESAETTESTPTYGETTLTPYELRTFIDVSQALLEDNAYNLESELVTDLAEAFGVTESAAFVSGDGDGKPKGLINASGITQVKTGNAATLGTAPADTIIGLYHSLPTAHAQRACWIMNRTTLGSLRTLKDTTGRFLLVDPVSAGMPLTLLGRPIVEAVDMPNVAANAIPIIFGDLQGYRIIDRVSFSLLRDPFSQATKGRVRLHARRRVGGDTTHPDRFVQLKVAA